MYHVPFKLVFICALSGIKAVWRWVLVGGVRNPVHMTLPVARDDDVQSCC